MHDTVQLGDADNLNNAQLGFFENDGDLLNPSTSSPPTAHADGAGGDDNELDPPLEEEEEEEQSSPQARFSKFIGNPIKCP